MHRLSGQDASFLYTETPSVHMHIAFTGVFTQPEAGEFTLDDLKALVSVRLPQLPVLSRKTREVPFGLHHPIWVDDPDFDLDYHIRRAVVRPPGEPAQLAEVVSDVLSRPLDRSRPLWELYLVEELDGGGFALVTKMHHAAVDGASGIELMTILLSPEPTPIPPRAQSTATADPIANDFQMLAAALADLIRHPGWMPRLPPAFGHQRSSATGTLLPKVPPWRSPLNGAITSHRRVVFTDLSFDHVQTVKNLMGCTVNDVVLALCGAALRRLLLREGLTESPSLVAGVPISVRTADERGAMGNRVSFMLVPLFTDISDPIDRLLAIRSYTMAAKALHNAVDARALTDWAVMGAPAIVAQSARLYSQLRFADFASAPCHTVVSNIPGPRSALYCGNSPMTAFYPTGPLGEGMGLNITLVSYLGRLGFSLITCPEIVSSADTIADDLHDALDELREEASSASRGKV